MKVHWLLLREQLPTSLWWIIFTARLVKIRLQLWLVLSIRVGKVLQRLAHLIQILQVLLEDRVLFVSRRLHHRWFPQLLHLCWSHFTMTFVCHIWSIDFLARWIIILAACLTLFLIVILLKNLINHLLNLLFAHTCRQRFMLSLKSWCLWLILDQHATYFIL